MLSYNEIKPKKFILLDSEPYEVLSSHVFRKQQRKPVNQTKLRHLTTGKVKEYSFHQSESVEEADINTKEVIYIFHKPNRQKGTEEYWFANPNDPSERFEINSETMGGTRNYLKENAIVTALTLNDEIINVSVPIKVNLLVKEAPPNIRGNTSQGGIKPVTLETGAIVNTPLFVEAGDVIEINTETGEYVRRV